MEYNGEDLLGKKIDNTQDTEENCRNKVAE